MKRNPIQQLLYCLFLAGLSASLCGCEEEAAANRSKTVAAEFGPTLVIKAAAPGFSAEEVAQSIATPIEQQFAAFDTLPLVESICTAGQVEFLFHTKAGCNLKQVESLIGDRLASLKESLPQALHDTNFRIQEKTTPLFVVAIYSPEGTQDPAFLSNFALTTLRGQLVQIPGVGEVTIRDSGSNGNDVMIKQFPGVAILIAPTVEANPTEIAAELKKRLDDLRAELPAGVVLGLPINCMDIADPRAASLLLEIQLPTEADINLRGSVLRETMTRISEFPGINHWVGFTRHPLESGNHNPCIILHAVATEPEQSSKKIRVALQQHLATSRGSRVRIQNFGTSDPSVIRAAVGGPDPLVAADLARKLAEKLQESRRYTAEQRRSPDAVKEHLSVKLDQSKLAAHGVTSADIAAALKETLGQQAHVDTAREQINLAESSDPASAAALRLCRVRNTAGHEIPLGDLASIQSVAAKLVVYRVNSQPAVLLVAQTLGEPDIQEAREQIGAFFAAACSNNSLGKEYKLTWLSD